MLFIASSLRTAIDTQTAAEARTKVEQSKQSGGRRTQNSSHLQLRNTHLNGWLVFAMRGPKKLVQEKHELNKQKLALLLRGKVKQR